MVFLALLDQVSHCNLGAIREEFPDKILNVLVEYLIGNAEHLEARTNGGVDEEL